MFDEQECTVNSLAMDNCAYPYSVPPRRGRGTGSSNVTPIINEDGEVSVSKSTVDHE